MVRICVVALVLLVSTAATAGAHSASLKSMTPVDGATVTARISGVTVRYSAAVSIREATITAPGGQPRRATVVAAPDRRSHVLQVELTKPGMYTLKWRVPQADGHMVGYTKTFTASESAVPAAAPPTTGSLWSRILRWLAALIG